MPRKFVAIIAAVVVCCAAACGYTIQQYLNIHGNYQGYWLPDDEVIFRNKTTGVTQVWRTNAATGRPEQITFFDEGVSYAVAHPVTGDVLAAADVGGDERDQLYLMNDDGSGVEALTDNPGVIYRYGDWSRDGRYVAFASNERDERYFDVYVYDVETGERRLVMRHDGYNSPLAFSPDGYELIVFRYNGSQDGDLYLIDLETGKTRHLTPHEGELEIGAVTWAADGYGFYFTSDEGRDFLSLAYYELATGEYEWLETPPWDLGEVEASWDGRYLLWTTNEDGYSVPHLRDLKRNKDLVTPRLPTEGVMWGMRFSPDEEYVVFTFSSPTTPTDVYVWDVRGETVERVTEAALAGIPADSFVAPELVFYPSFDGTTIPAFLYVPSGAPDDRSTPAVVYAHGGPQVQERPYFDAEGLRQNVHRRRQRREATRRRPRRIRGMVVPGRAAVVRPLQGSHLRLELRRLHGPLPAHAAALPLGRGYRHRRHRQFRHVPGEYRAVAGFAARGRVRLAGGGPRTPGSLLARKPHRRHPLAADGCPRRQRPARAGGRGRANSRGGARGPGRR
jgi:Tol biopolymer transport system component